MPDSHPLEVVDYLIQAGVPLVIIGGHAVNLHGFARATEDVDVAYRRNPETEILLSQALTDLGAFYIGDEIDVATGIETTYPSTLEYVRQHHLLMLGTRLGFLDVFDFVPGLPEVTVDELITTSVEFAGRRFVSLPWLRQMKQVADRPQDRIDLANLPVPGGD